MSNLPNTKEECKWWKIGYNTGIKEAERKNASYIRIGKPIIEEMRENFFNTSDNI